MLDGTPSLHPCLDCDSAGQMIPQAQPHLSYYTDIGNSEIEAYDLHYNNIEPSRGVGPNPIVTNALSTLVMYDLVAEFPETFPEEKPTELHTLREPLEMIQYRIHVIPDLVWKPRFPSTYNQFKHQITNKISKELDTARIMPSKSSNPIRMFMQPKKINLSTRGSYWTAFQRILSHIQIRPTCQAWNKLKTS